MSDERGIEVRPSTRSRAGHRGLAPATALILLAAACAVPQVAFQSRGLQVRSTAAPLAQDLPHDWNAVTGLQDGVDLLVLVDDSTIVDVVHQLTRSLRERRSLSREPVSGWLVQADLASLTLRPKSERSDLWIIAREDVVEVTSRTLIDDPVKDGVLIGLATALGAGTALLFAVNEAADLQGHQVLGLAAVAVAGGALGFWADEGRHSVREHVVYRRR